jgi:hypothetical protein
VSELEGLSKDELLQELQKAEAELEDLEEMRRFTLGQTGVHIGALRLKSMRAAWEREGTNLRQRIEAIKALLARGAEEAI